MGRKRKGRAVSGWVIIDKPAGPTSTDIVNKTRWAFNAQKAGHAGTLDPSATGLLAVALGEATKTIPYVTDAMKAYEFTICLGAATNTDDAEGEVIKSSKARPSDAQIIDALQGFIGEIEQIPPQFSAVKIEGQRAYALARAGQEFEVEPRPLFVEELLLIDRPDADHAILQMTCGKGGYVRSIARDLGEALGCYAHVKTLRRIWSGPFDLGMSTTVEEIEARAKQPEIDQLLKPLELGLQDLPEGRTTVEGAQKLRNGNPALCVIDAEYGAQVWASHQGSAVAIGRYKAGELHPARVINKPADD